MRYLKISLSLAESATRLYPMHHKNAERGFPAEELWHDLNLMEQISDLINDTKDRNSLAGLVEEVRIALKVSLTHRMKKKEAEDYLRHLDCADLSEFEDEEETEAEVDETQA